MGKGFGSFTKEKHLQAASKGGKNAQASGKGYRFTSETGKLAGRKGGKWLRKKV